MIGMAKELGAGDQAEALMTEVYQFEETLARVSHNFNQSNCQLWATAWGTFWILSLSFFSKNFVTSSRFLDTMSKKMRLQDLVEEVGKEVILSIFVFVSSTEFLLFGVSTSLPPSSSSSLGYSIGISVGADSKKNPDPARGRKGVDGLWGRPCSRRKLKMKLYTLFKTENP